MHRLLICVLLASSTLGIAQTPAIHSGATVYIEPMNGYETYLVAAFTKKRVPLIVVTDKTKADLIIASTVAHKDLGSGPAVVINNNNTAVGIGSASNDSPASRIQDSMRQGYAERAARKRALGETSAGIAVVDAKSSQVLFAHSSGKMGTNQLQNTATDCAKNLKEFIEKSEKSKK